MNAYTFEELEVGQEERFSRTVTPEMEGAFRAITGDGNPLHWDDGFAREISGGKFDGFPVFHVGRGLLAREIQFNSQRQRRELSEARLCRGCFGGFRRYRGKTG